MCTKKVSVRMLPKGEEVSRRPEQLAGFGDAATAREPAAERGRVLRRTVYALFVAAMMWLAPPGRAEAAGAEVHSAPLDEPVVYYQYTDKDDVIHFVDSREKIPRRYQDRVIVRKDTRAALQTTSIVIVDNQIHVPVSFRNGDKTVQAILLLDTGASITSITETLAARFASTRRTPVTCRWGWRTEE